MEQLKYTYEIRNNTSNGYRFILNISLRESVGVSDLLRVSGLCELIIEGLGLRFTDSNLARKIRSGRISNDSI